MQKQQQHANIYFMTCKTNSRETRSKTMRNSLGRATFALLSSASSAIVCRARCEERGTIASFPRQSNKRARFVQLLICQHSLSHPQIYLSQFGYLPPSTRNPSSGNLIDEETWTNAIKEFQSFAGVNITGESNKCFYRFQLILL